MNIEVAPSGGRAVRSVVSITLVCFAVSMIDGFDTLMLSFVAPLLAKSLQIDHASLGRVFGAGFVGTVLGSLIIGPLADRFGRRKMLVLALVVTGGFTLACAFASSAGGSPHCDFSAASAWAAQFRLSPPSRPKALRQNAALRWSS
jgi:AAHS family 4-hydroxybenzoate transporter-like MFS transporter